MQRFSASPREMIAALCRNRELIKVSAKREVLGRYRGSVLGILWSFLIHCSCCQFTLSYLVKF